MRSNILANILRATVVVAGTLTFAGCDWFTDFKQQPSVHPWGEFSADSGELKGFRGQPAGSVGTNGTLVSIYQVSSQPMPATIDSMSSLANPVAADERSLLNGRKYFQINCAVCHGYHGKVSVTGTHEFPTAPALWEKHRRGNVVGVSDDPPGETEWKVANGIRLTGMPAYKDVLNETQMWQVSLLLANADKPLPPSVVSILNGQTAETPEGPVPAPSAQPKK
mgnify:CR=1 FL=1